MKMEELDPGLQQPTETIPAVVAPEPDEVNIEDVDEELEEELDEDFEEDEDE